MCSICVIFVYWSWMFKGWDYEEIHWSWLVVLQGQKKGWVTGKVSFFRTEVLLHVFFGWELTYCISILYQSHYVVYHSYFSVGLRRFHSCWQFLTRCRWKPFKSITTPFGSSTFPCSIWFVPASTWLCWSSSSRQEESSVPFEACAGCDGWWRRR